MLPTRPPDCNRECQKKDWRRVLQFINVLTPHPHIQASQKHGLRQKGGISVRSSTQFSGSYPRHFCSCYSACISVNGVSSSYKQARASYKIGASHKIRESY